MTPKAKDKAHHAAEHPHAKVSAGPLPDGDAHGSEHQSDEKSEEKEEKPSGEEVADSVNQATVCVHFLSKCFMWNPKAGSGCAGS